MPTDDSRPFPEARPSPRLEAAILEIQRAREYSWRLIEEIPETDWFRQPAEGVTHVAWQVGHLALAEYALALERIRGPQPEDAEFMTPEFRVRYGKDSQPRPAPEANLAPSELKHVLRRVHLETLAEVPRLPDHELDQPPWKPHPLCRTKLEVLCWCARHEMLHAGQIGLLRRLLGRAPLW